MVSFPVGEGVDATNERMHVLPQGGDLFLLDNTPFYVYGVSFGDLVRAVEHDADLVFGGVVSRGGHSTYRIKLPAGADHSHFLVHWTGLERLGCSYEGSSAGARRLYAIDVPPGVDVSEVYRVLEVGENSGVWEFEEGHYYKS